MQKGSGQLLFSAGDVVAFLECEHATTFTLLDLETLLCPADDNRSLGLIQQKGFVHQTSFFSSLKDEGRRRAVGDCTSRSLRFTKQVEPGPNEIPLVILMPHGGRPRLSLGDC